jgi:hypothetical protein
MRNASARRANHTTVGGHFVPSGRGAFTGPYDSRIPRPEKIPEMLSELEAKLKADNEPSSELDEQIKGLAERIAKSFDYGIKAMDDIPPLKSRSGYPTEDSELYRRFYALCKVHNLHDGDKKPMILHATRDIDTQREVVEACLGLMGWKNTQNYTPSGLITALDGLSTTNPESTRHLVTTHEEKLLGNRAVRLHLAGVTSKSPEEIGAADLKGHYLPADAQPRTDS